jgi:hypothetical protein
MIKPNADRDELNSPFFLKNEETCKKWEALAYEHNGTISGSYNAWSYKLFIKIDEGIPCRITVSKATYSSGHLLISTKKQSLQELITFKLKIPSGAAFKIKRASWWELFRESTKHALKANPYYSILGEVDQTIYKKIVPILKPLFRTKKVLELTLEKGILTMKLNSVNNDFEVIRRLLDARKLFIGQ